MLLAASKSFRDTDEDARGWAASNSKTGYGKLNKKLINRWEVLIKKLRSAANRDKRKNK